MNNKPYTPSVSTNIRRTFEQHGYTFKDTMYRTYDFRPLDEWLRNVINGK